MSELKTQKDFRHVWNRIDFCYECGVDFKKDDQGEYEKTKDHIPPSSIFLTPDRNAPLILPAHRKCNGKQSISDEQIGQLVGLLHGKVVTPEKKRLDIELIGFTKNADLGGAVNLDLKAIIARWIRGFHAALYLQALPQDTKRAIHPPMPAVRKVDRKVIFESILPQQPVLVDVIRQNRDKGRLDRIVCRNNKCIYECVWDRLDDGDWICCFALQIYNWKDLGDSARFPTGGCVGAYQPPSGLPPTATKGIELKASDIKHETLDPFDQ